MNTEERTRHEVLLENLETTVRVIAEAHAGNTELLHATRAELERRIDEVDHRIIVLDVKVHEKIDALDHRVGALEKRVGALEEKVGALEEKVDKLDRKIDALERKLDGKLDAMSIQLSHIATHLGLAAAPPRARRN